MEVPVLFVPVSLSVCASGASISWVRRASCSETGILIPSPTSAKTSCKGDEDISLLGFTAETAFPKLATGRFATVWLPRRRQGAGCSVCSSAFVSLVNSPSHFTIPR